jgi:hypothetical protein
MKTSETRPIVCGTDFPESAAQTTPVADALGQRLGAPLLLVRRVDERGQLQRLAARPRVPEGRQNPFGGEISVLHRTATGAQ